MAEGSVPSTLSTIIRRNTASSSLPNPYVPKVVAYFQPSGDPDNGSLRAHCDDVNIDVFIIGFVYAFAGSTGGTPVMSTNYDIECAADQSGDPTSCPQLEQAIQYCQQKGKMVFIGVGGPESSIDLLNDDVPDDLAHALWMTYGPPSEESQTPTPSRPFGNAVVDGFDLYFPQISTAENKLAQSLRALFDANEASRTYYLSGSPSCEQISSSSAAQYLCDACDYVSPRFFSFGTRSSSSDQATAPSSCYIGQEGFDAALKGWSAASSSSSSSSVHARLYVGAPASSGADQATPNSWDVVGGIEGMQKLARGVKDMELSNFGGFAFWDSVADDVEQVDGKDIFALTSEVLRD
ncbi:glycoside hydrolase superfamily [Xylariomycetidae sp. FL2044]|nr:glycoside hydrolase superfamily [Xylariomycetidae sp. FL2044]